MPARNLLRLFILLNRGTRRRLIAGGIGLTLGVLLVTLFVAVGSGVKTAILDNLLGALPLTQIKVQPRSMAVGVLRLGRPGGGDGRIDGKILALFRAMPEVKAVYGIAYARFPVSVHGEILGSTYGTDAPMQGVEPDWVRDDLGPSVSFAASETGPVPVLLSRKILHAYNVGFAAANRLPQITEGAVIGQELTIEFGWSTIGGSRAGRERRSAVVVALSDRVDVLAVAVPLDVLRQYARRLSGSTADECDAAVIEVHSTRDLSAVEAEIDRQGLEIAPDAHLGRRVAQAVTIVVVTLSAIGIAVVVISLLNIANTLSLVLRERKYELAVVRAAGMSERLLRGLLLGEAALSGLLSAAVGLGISTVALAVGARLLERPLAPILGGGLPLAVPGWLIVALLFGTPLVSALVAAVPAHRATGSSIANALRR